MEIKLSKLLRFVDIYVHKNNVDRAMVLELLRYVTVDNITGSTLYDDLSSKMRTRIHKDRVYGPRTAQEIFASDLMKGKIRKVSLLEWGGYLQPLKVETYVDIDVDVDDVCDDEPIIYVPDYDEVCIEDQVDHLVYGDNVVDIYSQGLVKFEDTVTMDIQFEDRAGRWCVEHVVDMELVEPRAELEILCVSSEEVLGYSGHLVFMNYYNHALKVWVPCEDEMMALNVARSFVVFKWTYIIPNLDIGNGKLLSRCSCLMFPTLFCGRVSCPLLGVLKSKQEVVIADHKLYLAEFEEYSWEINVQMSLVITALAFMKTSRERILQLSAVPLFRLGDKDLREFVDVDLLADRVFTGFCPSNTALDAVRGFVEMKTGYWLTGSDLVYLGFLSKLIEPVVVEDLPFGDLVSFAAYLVTSMSKVEVQCRERHFGVVSLQDLAKYPASYRMLLDINYSLDSQYCPKDCRIPHGEVYRSEMVVEDVNRFGSHRIVRKPVSDGGTMDFLRRHGTLPIRVGRYNVYEKIVSVNAVEEMWKASLPPELGEHPFRENFFTEVVASWERPQPLSGPELELPD